MSQWRREKGRIHCHVLLTQSTYLAHLSTPHRSTVKGRELATSLRRAHDAVLESKEDVINEVKLAREGMTKDLAGLYVDGQEAVRKEVAQLKLDAHEREKRWFEKLEEQRQEERAARKLEQEAREEETTRSVRKALREFREFASAQKTEVPDVLVPTNLTFLSSRTCVSQEETPEFADDDASTSHVLGSLIPTRPAGPLPPSARKSLLRTHASPSIAPASHRDASPCPPRTPVRYSAVKTQAHFGVEPRETPQTDRMAKSERRHIGERREGRRRSNYTRRCHGESEWARQQQCYSHRTGPRPSCSSPPQPHARISRSHSSSFVFVSIHRRGAEPHHDGRAPPANHQVEDPRPDEAVLKVV